MVSTLLLQIHFLIINGLNIIITNKFIGYKRSQHYTYKYIFGLLMVSKLLLQIHCLVINGLNIIITNKFLGY